MRVGEVFRFTSDQAVGHGLRDKLHVFICRTDHFRAPEEFAFLFISSSNYGACFPICQSDYSGFLTHDSHISCGNLVFYGRDYLEQAGMVPIGQISDNHLFKLRYHLADHEIMVGWQINLVCAALPVA